MAQGEFTKEEVKETKTAVGEIYNALANKKKAEFLGHLNDIFLFLQAAEIEAPNEEKETKNDSNN